MRGLGQAFIVVDGLDECSEELRWELLETLGRLPSSLHLLITSRYLDAIAEELENFERCEVRANPEDIELFIDHQIKKNRNLGKLVQKAPFLRMDIKNAVVKTAENMFLLAQLHVESIASAAGLSVRHVRQKLQALPTTLTGTYDNAMQRIEDQEPDHRQIACKTLAWMSYALRSLSLGELQHALAIEPSDTVLDEELLMDGQGITALCAGLVVVDHGTNMVNLVHYSTKDYFEKNREKVFPNFHAAITISCATYLNLDALKNVPLRHIVQNYPLAYYAAQYLGDHARQTPEEALEPSVLETICQLLSHPENRGPLLSLLAGLDLIRAGFYSLADSNETTNEVEADLKSTLCKALSFPEDSLSITTTLDGAATPRGDDAGRPSLSTQLTDSSIDTMSTLESDSDPWLPEKRDLWEQRISSSRIPEVTALHLAASMGLAKVASTLLKETPNIDAVDETGKTALTVAMERGFEKAVEFLVNSGAFVDLKQEHGRSVLLMALERNWRSAGDIIVAKARSLLQEAGLNEDYGQVAFLLATYEMDFDKVTELAYSLDLRSTDREAGELALFLATESDATKMVEMLLQLGISVNARDSTGQTALHRATRRRCEPMIKLLLTSGIQVDSQDDEGKTAWSSNLRSFDKKILGLLLKEGADPSTRGLQGVSELYTAAVDGEIDLVKFMLESGTDPCIQTEYQWAPIHWAASYGHIDCLNLHIAAGANVSVASDQGVTPLDLAVQSGQIAALEILKRAGAISAAGRTPIAGSSDPEPEQIPLKRTISDFDALIHSTVLDFKLLPVFDKPLIRTLANRTNFGQFIYPRVQKGHSVPDHFIYHVSHVMETTASSISVRRARHRAEMREHPLSASDFDHSNSLYDIRRLGPDYQEVELLSGTQSLLEEPLSVHNDWTGSWKVRRNDGQEGASYIFRTTPDLSNAATAEGDCRWVTERGSVLARSGWDDATPNVCFEPGQERRIIDAVVACWVAKLWAEHAVKTPSPNW